MMATWTRGFLAWFFLYPSTKHALSTARPVALGYRYSVLVGCASSMPAFLQPALVITAHATRCLG